MFALVALPLLTLLLLLHLLPPFFKYSASIFHCFVFCLSCSCQRHLLNHDATQVVESFFDHLHPCCPLRLSDSNICPSWVCFWCAHQRFHCSEVVTVQGTAVSSTTTKFMRCSWYCGCTCRHSVIERLSASFTHRHQLLHYIFLDETVKCPQSFHVLPTSRLMLPCLLQNGRLQSPMFVVSRMVLKKASISPAGPVFPCSGIRQEMYNAKSFGTQPRLSEGKRLCALQL